MHSVNDPLKIIENLRPEVTEDLQLPLRSMRVLYNSKLNKSPMVRLSRLLTIIKRRAKIILIFILRLCLSESRLATGQRHKCGEYIGISSTHTFFSGENSKPLHCSQLSLKRKKKKKEYVSTCNLLFLPGYFSIQHH